MINNEKTELLNKTEKYIKFIEWCLNNGAKLSNNVLYPSAFGTQGFTGVSAKQNIPANTILIAIPNKLIISYNKVLKSELSCIFQENLQFFDEQKTADAEFNCLALFIFYQKLKGEQSFWYPYLNVVEQHTLFEWRNRDLFYLQDQSFVDEFMHVQAEMDKSWYRFKKLMNKYPQIFGNITEKEKDLFYWSNEFVMTRCFGWTLPSTSLVPLADMLNHSNENPATYHLIKKQFEQNNHSENKYTLKNGRIDMNLIDINIQLDPKYQIRNHKQEYVKINQQLLPKDYSQLTIDDQINLINLNVLKLWKEKQVWELDFESSSDSDDNDTDSDSDDEQQDRFHSIRKKEFILFTQKQQKQHDEQTEKCQDIITQVLPKQIQVKFNNSNIHIKGIESNILQNNEEESNCSNDSEKDFDWFSDDDDDIYFCITSTGEIKQNEQIYTFYGRRNNRFLLMWYGFALKTNKYNSYCFRLWLNPNPMAMSDQIYQKIIITDILNLNHLEQGTIHGIPIKQLSNIIKLKGNKLQEDLIIYMRLFLMAYYFGNDANSILLTIPISIDFEIFVFDFTLKFLSSIVQKFPSSYQEDLILIEDQKLSGEEYFGLSYRSGQKELILLQINHIMEVLKLLRNLKSNPQLNIKDYFMTQSNSINKMRSLKQYIKYL